MLEIQHLKECIGTLEDENENLKNSISKIEHEARKDKMCIGDELIALCELIRPCSRNQRLCLKLVFEG